MAGLDQRSLLNDALRIWRAGVAAVAPERLLSEAIRLDGSLLSIETTRGDGVDFDLTSAGRIIVVGGGKAGAGMARGFEAALAPLVDAGRVEGLLSVPANCVGRTQSIELVGGRPPGVNEPRPEGAAATSQMLRLVREASPDDVVVCLLSGGGSALLPAPAEGLTLDDKIAVATLLAAAGATIDELNTVRQHLSHFKGGGLARACRAGRLLTLMISDVLGDPLDLIASGPTVEPHATPAEALAVLERLGLGDEPRLLHVVEVLRAKTTQQMAQLTTDATTLVLANNATAVDAAGVEAERLGYSHAMDCARRSEGSAEEVGRHLAQMALRMRDSGGANEPDCLITGGEPTVTLAPPDVRGKGGRNQQLVLAALQKLGDCRGVALVSGGTDGEDGPTDAAGAMIDEGVASRLADADLAEALRRNDAYPLFERADALLKTGPTNTNVCDLRVVTVGDANDVIHPPT
jgi:hydroxypyruvate reductase